MATTFGDGASGRGRNYRKRMSSHLAAALMCFALLQILIVVGTGGSLPFHLGVIVAIGGFAIAAGALERRWILLEAGDAPDDRLSLRFRRDVRQLWAASILGACLWFPVSLFFRFLLG
ncbi:hypothetical protein WG908_12395 [Sphingobium sp. AN641]|uniref:hypothetical protein n=1 Tax=Sphingobium sp. AN641 TaxID=3133443 RepID=UPI0030C1779B